MCAQHSLRCWSFAWAVLKLHSRKELEGEHEEDKVGHHIGTSVNQWEKRHTAEDQQVAQNLLAYLHHVFFFLKRKRENCQISNVYIDNIYYRERED